MALSVPEVGAIYLDSAEFGAEQWNEWVSRCHEADKQCLLVMPHIFRDRAKEYFETHRSRLESAGFDGLVIRAWEELELVREWKISIPLVMDYGIYTMNHRAEDFVREMAPELSMRFYPSGRAQQPGSWRRATAGNGNFSYMARSRSW